MYPRLFAIAVLIGLTLMISLGGCASTSKAESSTESMAAMSARLDKASAQVNSVLASLDAVLAAKNDDLRSPYKKFSDEVEKTEESAARARASAESVKARGQEHFDSWADESQNIGDPALQQANLARRSQAKAAFAKVQDATQEAKIAYEPFIASLRDIRTFLGTDLTSHGVDAVAATISKAKTDGQNLKLAIAKVQTSVNEVKSQLVSPSK